MILKATKKPITITVIRAQDIELYREQFHIEVDDRTIYNQNAKEYKRFQEGDYINVTDPNDIYAIPKEYFESNYVVVMESE